MELYLAAGSQTQLRAGKGNFLSLLALARFVSELPPLPCQVPPRPKLRCPSHARLFASSRRPARARPAATRIAAVRGPAAHAARRGSGAREGFSAVLTASDSERVRGDVMFCFRHARDVDTYHMRDRTALQSASAPVGGRSAGGWARPWANRASPRRAPPGLLFRASSTLAAPSRPLPGLPGDIHSSGICAPGEAST